MKGILKVYADGEWIPASFHVDEYRIQGLRKGETFYAKDGRTFLVKDIRVRNENIEFEIVEVK